MASIQILELRPAETSIEDLSDDVAGNITGGGFLEQVGLIIERLILFAETVTELCASGALPVEICDEIY